MPAHLAFPPRSLQPARSQNTEEDGCGLTVSRETRYLRGMSTKQGIVQSIFRSSFHVSLSALLLASSLAGQTARSSEPPIRADPDYTRNVDPFIGVDWGGNTFVGSAIPYGLVKVGPDMETFDGRRSGFG